MSIEPYPPIHKQKGPHNSAAHESLRAAARCLRLHKRNRIVELAVYDAFNVQYGSQLSEEQARGTRRFLELHLPECSA